MLINFESFLVLLSFVWIVGEVLVQALKGVLEDKFHIDKMLYSVITFFVLGIFAIVYDVVSQHITVDPVFILNCIVFLVLCVLIPITGYDKIVDLIKRLLEKAKK